MRTSTLLFAQLLSTFACVLADEWSIIPPAPSPKPTVAAEWKIIDGVPVSVTPRARPDEWLVLPIAVAPTKPTDGSPDNDSATDGHSSPNVSPPIPKPVKLACTVDCVCGVCDCEKCLCCSGYAELERVCLKTGHGAIVYVGDRGEDADAARREAMARKLHFLSAKQIAGKDDAGKATKFPAGTSELKPIGGELYFVPREKRRIPRPDRERSALDRIASPLDCPTGT